MQELEAKKYYLIKQNNLVIEILVDKVSETSYYIGKLNGRFGIDNYYWITKQEFNNDWKILEELK
jgi:hypothetical protein